MRNRNTSKNGRSGLQAGFEFAGVNHAEQLREIFQRKAMETVFAHKKELGAAAVLQRMLQKSTQE
jgi:hypothetical protein